MINRPLFRKITRRIEYFGGSKALALLQDVYLSTPELTIDSSAQRYKSILHMLLLHLQISRKQNGLHSSSSCIGAIEFTRVRSLRCTSRKQRCLRSRESSRGGTLERLLYIYYWSAISQRNIANRSDKIEQRSSIQDDVCNRWTNLEVIINTSDLSKTTTRNLK